MNMSSGYGYLAMPFYSVYAASKAAVRQFSDAMRRGLHANSIEKLVQWPFGDFIFNTEYDAFFDVNKARRFGFHEMHIDSIDYMLQTFQGLKDARIIP